MIDKTAPGISSDSARNHEAGAGRWAEHRIQPSCTVGPAASDAHRGGQEKKHVLLRMMPPCITVSCVLLLHTACRKS